MNALIAWRLRVLTTGCSRTGRANLIKSTMMQAILYGSSPLASRLTLRSMRPLTLLI